MTDPSKTETASSSKTVASSQPVSVTVGLALVLGTWIAICELIHISHPSLLFFFFMPALIAAAVLGDASGGGAVISIVIFLVIIALMLALAVIPIIIYLKLGVGKIWARWAYIVYSSSTVAGLASLVHKPAAAKFWMFFVLGIALIAAGSTLLFVPSSNRWFKAQQV